MNIVNMPKFRAQDAVSARKMNYMRAAARDSRMPQGGGSMNFYAGAWGRHFLDVQAGNATQNFTFPDNVTNFYGTDQDISKVFDGTSYFETVETACGVMSYNQDGVDTDWVFGSYQLDDTGAVANDARMFYDKGEASFRAGGVIGAEWDAANRGDYSVAFGSNTIASGISSVAAGGTTTASGDFSYVVGTNNTAAARGSFAVGGTNTIGAAAQYSAAMGFGHNITGFNSVAAGNQNTVAGDYAASFGRSHTSSGDYGFATGFNHTAAGVCSCAIGYQNVGSVFCSTAIGYLNTASDETNISIGRSVSTNAFHTAIGIGFNFANNVAQSVAFGINAKVFDVQASYSRNYFYMQRSTANPAGFAAPQHNYAITAEVSFLTVNAPSQITGIVAKNDGTRITLVNNGPAPATIMHQNAGSAAANRFQNQGGANISVGTDDAREYVYDTTAGYWRDLGGL